MKGGSAQLFVVFLFNFPPQTPVCSFIGVSLLSSVNFSVIQPQFIKRITLLYNCTVLWTFFGILKTYSI